MSLRINIYSVDYPALCGLLLRENKPLWDYAAQLSVYLNYEKFRNLRFKDPFRDIEEEIAKYVKALGKKFHKAICAENYESVEFQCLLGATFNRNGKCPEPNIVAGGRTYIAPSAPSELLVEHQLLGNAFLLREYAAMTDGCAVWGISRQVEELLVGIRNGRTIKFRDFCKPLRRGQGTFSFLRRDEAREIVLELAKIEKSPKAEISTKSLSLMKDYFLPALRSRLTKTQEFCFVIA